MVSYNCSKCNKIFNKKSHYITHINRKNKCDNIADTLNCIYCKKLFATKGSMTRHIKSNCPELLKSENEKQKIYAELLQLKQLQLKQLQQEIDELQQQMTVDEKGTTNDEQMNHNINNNTMNNINNNNNINTVNNNNTVNNINNGTINNITIIAYGSEDISTIQKKDIIKAIGTGYHSTINLTKTLHFNANHPEYHNVYIPSIKQAYAMIYDGTKWKLVQKQELIEDMYNDKKDYIEENLEEFAESLSMSKIKALERWLESDENDDKCIQKIKKDIELLLYNERKIPLTTTKTINK